MNDTKNKLHENDVLNAVDSIPRDESGPVFKAPWEAEAFAMTLALYEKGVFTWPQWAKVLSSEIDRAQNNGDPDLGDTYYLHWLAALERIVVEQGITNQQQLAGLYKDWNNAALSTPHGQPIVLGMATTASNSGDT